ncbi:cytochrome c-type biogenesis protein [groundwater metagenome]
MLTSGNAMLYASIVVSAAALLGLLLKEFKRGEIFTKLVTPAILLSAGILTFAYLLLTYYFVVSDFTYEYVWQYSSTDLPVVYKLTGTWAGQPGTYLLWVWIIFLSAAWLAVTTKHSTPLARRTQIITLVIGIYFIVLTLIQTPFKSIYELPDIIDLIASGDLPANFVPAEGNGLNALLVNFWMIVHPPLMFIGYGAMTIPFAAAIVYLLTKEDGWEELGRQWARFTWLFLGMGIAVGGVWAYVVLGWGGFWAWDPVETASLIPWLTLTGFLHAAALHRKNKKTFSIAAPMLAAVSFILVIYAAIVVRSGLFNSVHAFGETSTGTLLIISLLVTTVLSLALGMKRYFEETENAEEDRGFWNKTNIFYITLLLFVVLAFVSFWGISFPVFIQLTQNVKVNVASDTKNFFNAWSYPFTLILLLALGFCLNYKETLKEKQKKMLFIVMALTILTMLPRTDNFYVLDHNSPFWVREPGIYKLIGSISLLSIFPPLIYAAASVIEYLNGYMRATNLRVKIKGIGIVMVHIAVVLILIGAVVSSTRTTNIDRINIPIAAQGQLFDVGNDYGIRVIELSSRSLTENSCAGGTKISDILSNPAGFATGNIQVSGKVTEVINTQTDTPPITYTAYLKLDDGTGSIWAATQAAEPISIPEGITLSVKGFLMAEFKSSSINRTFDIVIFSRPDEVGEVSASGRYNVQSVRLEVYKGNNKIATGTAEYLEGKGGSGTFPMVYPSLGLLAGDVYVIFQGTGGGAIPLTLKIVPAINLAWIGIMLFAIGIILIMLVKSKSRGD